MRLLGNIGMVLLVVGGFIFYLGFEVANYNIHFLVIGGTTAAIGFYSLKFLSKKEDESSFAAFDKWRKDLKTNGIEIAVDFDQCELKSNQYREKIERDISHSSEDEVFDALMGHMTPEYNDVDQSVIVFKTEFKGKETTFYSPTINKEKVTLQFLLADKKSTKIYVDRLNKDNYYFDLEFIWQ